MSRTPLEQLNDEFRFMSGIVFDINDDVRQLKTKDPNTQGGLQAALVTVAVLIVATGQRDLYKEVLDRVLKGLKATREQSTDSPNTTAFVEGHIDFFQDLVDCLEKLPGPPSLPGSE